ATSGPVSETALPWSYRYDPALNGSVLVAPLPTPRWAHSATLLPNGRVLIAGGYAPYVGYMARTALYDPNRDVWTAREVAPPIRPDFDEGFGTAGSYIYSLGGGVDFKTRMVLPLSHGGVLALGGVSHFVNSFTLPWQSSFSFKLTD